MARHNLTYFPRVEGSSEISELLVNQKGAEFKEWVEKSGLYLAASDGLELKPRLSEVGESIIVDASAGHLTGVQGPHPSGHNIYSRIMYGGIDCVVIEAQAPRPEDAGWEYVTKPISTAHIQINLNPE